MLQVEIDRIREAADGESLASPTVQALRRELRAHNASAYRTWDESLPDEVRADLKAWDEAPMPERNA